MGLFDSLFGDPHGAAQRAQSTIEGATQAGRGRIEDAGQQAIDTGEANAAPLRALADQLTRQTQPSALETQSAVRSARQGAQGALRQQSAAGGMSNAQRVQAAELVASAQAQGLLAERAARLQRQTQLNGLIAQQLQAAGQFTQAGVSANLSALASFEQGALNATSQAALARAQAESQASPFGKFLASAAATAGTIAGAGGFGNPFGVPE